MAGDAGKIALEASGVRKTFSKDGRSLAVVDVERFCVRDCEFVTVIGPSGCGKSTLLHIMGGFIQAEAGAIHVHGRRVNGPGRDRGMMFQEFALFPWKTVAGNVAWGLETQGLAKDKIKKSVDEHLAMIGLTDFRNHYPAELSGGMKQRVAIARSLVLEPKILLMDEPFGALDEQTRIILGEELLRIRDQLKQTIILVTHNINESVQLSDRVIVMTARPGRVKSIVDIDLPHPRDSSIIASETFGRLVARVWSALREESIRSFRQTEQRH